MTNFQTRVLLWIVGTTLLVGILIGSGVITLRNPQAISAPSAPSRLVASAPTRVTDADDNDGTDARRPILPATDVGFVDSRGGWEWGNRCWTNIAAKKWGWAKAECDEAMKLDPAAPQPRASLLYNEGLIASHLGDDATARSFFTESLAIRENAEVRQALESLSAVEEQ